MIDTYTTRPIEEVDNLRFSTLIKDKKIEVSPHAVDHLSEKQRKVFKADELTFMIERETPRKIFLQKNGRYAAYYRKADGYRKLILDMQDEKILIVTFIDTIEIPKITMQYE